MYEHRNKLIEGFTSKYNIHILIYYEIFMTPYEAISAEKKIKGWIRAKKIDLIKTRNPAFDDLLNSI